MKRRVVITASLSTLIVLTMLPTAAAARSPERFDRIDTGGLAPRLDALPSRQDPDRMVDVFVELAGRPVATAMGIALAAGREIGEEQKSALRQPLLERQALVKGRLQGMAATIEASFTDVLNAIRIRVPARRLPRIAGLPEVIRVSPVPRHVRDNGDTVDFLGADQTWGATGFTGKGVSIAIIDTGLNYYHRDFGGPSGWHDDDGLDRSDGNFPTAKVIAGWDFAGDDYDPDDPANDVPRPDNDPLDCKHPGSQNGQHGTHVAGTAAGMGVLSDGTTFTGPYDADTLAVHDFRIAPGVAPEAPLMAFRVFGCRGGSLLVVDAVEEAVRRGADVINMSLGSPFGHPGSVDAVAVDNAALAGVTVVMSAGNNGASAYITSTPGVATRGISVAAIDATHGTFHGHTARFTSGGPRRGDSMIKPDVAAPGLRVVSADGATVGGAKTFSGTSMAAPAVAGVAALVIEAHPGWTSAAVKAAIIGTASLDALDAYEVRLAGSGVARPRRAVDTRAYAVTMPGASSLVFGHPQLDHGPEGHHAYSDARALTLVNRGASAITYDLVDTFTTDDLGLKVSISPATVTVPAGRRREVHVTLRFREHDVEHLPGAAPFHGPLYIQEDQYGQAFSASTDVAGAIVAVPRDPGPGVYRLRIPWLVAPRGLSDIGPGRKAANTPVPGGWVSEVRLKNRGIHEGIGDVFAWGLMDADDGLDGMDLRAVGVQSIDPLICASDADDDDECLVFAVDTWGQWNNPSENELDVLIDTDRDRVADFTVIGLDLGLVLGGYEGLYGSMVVDLATDTAVVYNATAPNNGGAALLPVLASDLGLSPGVTDGRFDYIAESFDVYDGADGTPGQTDEATTGQGSGPQWARNRAFGDPISNGDFLALEPGQRADLPLTVSSDGYDPRRGMKGWMVVTLEDRTGASHRGETQADLIPVGPTP